MLREMNPLGATVNSQHARETSTSRISASSPRSIGKDLSPSCSLDVGKTPFYNGALIRPKLNAERRMRFC